MHNWEDYTLSRGRTSLASLSEECWLNYFSIQVTAAFFSPACLRPAALEVYEIGAILLSHFNRLILPRWQGGEIINNSKWAWLLNDWNFFRELREYFINSYDLTELLFSGIKGNHGDPCICTLLALDTPLIDDRYFYKSPDRLRLPLIFYLGHTATLYINKLVLAGLLEVWAFFPCHFSLFYLSLHSPPSSYLFSKWWLLIFGGEVAIKGIDYFVVRHFPRTFFFLQSWYYSLNTMQMA